MIGAPRALHRAPRARGVVKIVDNPLQPACALGAPLIVNYCAQWR